VIRTGYGIFHSNLLASNGQNHPGNIPGLSQGVTVLRQQVPTLVGLPFPAISATNPIIDLWAIPKDWKTPYSQYWTFNIQQGFGNNSLLQIGYVGKRGLHENAFVDINALRPGATVRPNPLFGQITNLVNGNSSNYHALQLTGKRRFSHGVTFNANYTWSHSLDQGGGTFGPRAQDYNNQRAEYGNADGDVRHMLEFDYTFEIPSIPHSPSFLNGWQVNGITIMRSGIPIYIQCGCDSRGIGVATARPNLVPGVPLRPANFDIPNAQLNIAAFSTPAAGTFGNLGRNVITAPPAYNWDFSLFKNFKFRETQNVQFRAEAFNIFNTPQFSNPGATLTAPASFGRSLTTFNAVGGFPTNRQMQLALRYSF